MFQKLFSDIKSFLGGQYFLIFIATIVLTLFLAFLVLFITALLTRKNYGKIFKEISSVLTTILCLVLACELDAYKIYVASFFDLFIYAILFLTVAKIFENVIKIPHKKPIAKPLNIKLSQGAEIDVQETVPERNDVIKKAVERLSCKGENTCLCDGYVDVSRLKTLIDGVKQNALASEDEKFIENAELNLLNFATRQPTPDERVVLSEQIGSLVKLIAKYQ